MDATNVIKRTPAWLIITLGVLIGTWPLVGESDTASDDSVYVQQLHAIRQAIAAYSDIGFGESYMALDQLVRHDTLKSSDTEFVNRVTKEYTFESNYLSILFAKATLIDGDAQQLEMDLTDPNSRSFLAGLKHDIPDHCASLQRLKANTDPESATRAQFKLDFPDYIRQVAAQYPNDASDLERARAAFSPDVSDSIFPRLVDACAKLVQVSKDISP